jgi:hypothetical protein
MLPFCPPESGHLSIEKLARQIAVSHDMRHLPRYSGHPAKASLMETALLTKADCGIQNCTRQGCSSAHFKGACNAKIAMLQALP